MKLIIVFFLLFKPILNKKVTIIYKQIVFNNVAQLSFKNDIPLYYS